VKYDCNQCEFKPTPQSSLTWHTQTKCEEVRYSFNSDDYLFTLEDVWCLLLKPYI